MKDFKTWWAEAEIFCGDGGMEAAEQAYDAAQDLTAKRCREIAQQHYLAVEPAVEIDDKISKEFRIQTKG